MACVDAHEHAADAPRFGPCGTTSVPYRPVDASLLPGMEQITDEESGLRTYRVTGGAYYPSVTTVLGATSTGGRAMEDWRHSVGPDVARHIAGTQAAVGTEVHERLSLYVRGLDPWRGYGNEWDRPIDVRGHYDQLVKFACSRLETTIASEAAMWSHSLGVAGSVDLVAVLDHTWGDMSGKLAVVDFKCLRSPPAPDKTDTYLAQCAAYAVMWTEHTEQKIECMVVAQSVATGGVAFGIEPAGGRHLEAFVRRKLEFDMLKIALPGRDYAPRAACDGTGRPHGAHAESAAPPAKDEARRMERGTRPFIVWMTGLPASGKSSILRELRRMVSHLVILGGEETREWLCPTDHTRIGLGRHSARIARLAAYLYRSGVSVGVATCSPYPENRHAARGIIGADTDGAHLECYVKCPKSICEERDRHGLYEKARAGHMPWLAGEGEPYIPPNTPDMVLDSEHDDPAASATRILNVLRHRSLVA